MNKQAQGFALVTTLLIAAIVGVLITGSLVLATVNRRISANDSLSTQALNVAQAGSAFWKAELVSLYRFMMNNPALYQDDITAYQANSSNPPIACDNYFAIGIDLNRDGTVDTANAGTATKGTPKPLTPDRNVPVGTTDGLTQVSFYIDGSTVGLRSRGSFAGARATVVEEFTLSQANIWNNAVFASSTAADAVVRGRAEIRGSIHVLGEGVSSTTTVLDVSGSFGLGNTYEGLVSSVAQDVTGSSNTMRLTNQRPRDLCAALRVKNGKVNMGGSATIGYSETTNGEPYKDLMSGVYTNHGITGGAEGNNVHSKNGMSAKYDVGDLYDFPDLTDNADDYNYAANTYPWPKAVKVWQDKLRDNSLVLSTDLTRDDRNILPRLLNDTNSSSQTTPNTPTGGWQRGMTYLSVGCNAALFGVNVNGTRVGGGAATLFALTNGTTPAFECRKYRVIGTSPDKSKDEIVAEVVWSGGSTKIVKDEAGTNRTMQANELYVGGMGGGVMFYGRDLTISGGDIGYYGNGVLFAEDSNRELVGGTGGNVNFTSDFTPATNNDFALVTDRTPVTASTAPNTDGGRMKTLGPSPRVATTYPATALVSVVARRNVSTDGAQRRLSTTVYAQEEVAVNQQVVLAGSIVTKSFDAGAQVPTVLYVPNLAQNLSKLMPGTGGNTFSLSNTAWNRR